MVCNLRSLIYNSGWCLPGLFPLHSLSCVTSVTFWMVGELGDVDLTRAEGTLVELLLLALLRSAREASRL